eukprot:g4335.t1
MSPIIRRPSRDEVEEKLSEYLATSPHCKLEFCRLNQGWYQYRHATDSSVPQKCIEEGRLECNTQMCERP